MYVKTNSADYDIKSDAPIVFWLIVLFFGMLIGFSIAAQIFKD
jgi:hypothetical protein